MESASLREEVPYKCKIGQVNCVHLQLLSICDFCSSIHKQPQQIPSLHLSDMHLDI